MDLDKPEVKRNRSASPDAGSEGASKKPRLAPDSELVTPTLTPGEATPSTEDALGQNDVKTAARRSVYETLPMPVSRLGLKPVIPDLPPSLAIVMGVQHDEMKARRGLVGQEEVGIIGYAGPKELKGVRGVIKQRFTDFLVNEVMPNGEVLHLRDIGKPLEPTDEVEAPAADSGGAVPAIATESAAAGESAPSLHAGATVESDTQLSPSLPESLSNLSSHPAWSISKAQTLRKHFSDEAIVSLHALLVEGRDPPPKSDNGWGIRKPREQVDPEEAAMNVEEAAIQGVGAEAGPSDVGGGGRGRGQGRERGRGRGARGGRGGRGGARLAEQGKWWTAYEDEREVVSQPMPLKEDRSAAHKVIRELFPGTFETGTKQVEGEEALRLTVKWSRGQAHPRREKQQQSARKRLPAYIHFTLQKSNRETLDALGHLARSLGCHNKDLSVCGTKDKRAVTVQRVCLKRNGRTLGSVWKAVNGIKNARRTAQQAVTERGERGARIGDLEYSDRYLELGMLKGNYFVITLRNVQAESTEEIDAIMSSLRDRGFINFYGMQRFGTSTVPTHVTGLQILQRKWGEALDGILTLREGEHPDCVRARLAWLEDKDLDKALEIMPRRCVAERSIWEFWRRRNGDTADRVGALGTIPRNLRTMYVHAYQSYIWNLVVSERIKLSATSPLVGDLVYVNPTDDEASTTDPASNVRYPPRKSQPHATSSSQEVRQLTEDDLDKYTIFDVVMPLPGFDVEYPSGRIGELYMEIMKADGLDPHRMRREQREYSLPGSYRRIINKPSHVSWRHIRYTDPDVGLAQSDEDELLHLNIPAEDDPEGKFRAVRVELQLGASAYATMALREVTREETSTWHHIGLTVEGEDQAHKRGGGGAGDVPGDEEVDDGDEGEGEAVSAE